MKSWMTDAMLETQEQIERREKRKENRHKRLVEEQIAIAIVSHNKEKAISLAEKYGITPQDFAKLVVRYS